MNRRITGVIGVAAALGLAATAVSGPATATPAADPDAIPTHVQKKADDRPDPLNTKRRAAKARATELVVTGEKPVRNRGGSKVVEVAPGEWVEYGTQETAQLLSFLVEFGDQVDPRFADQPAGPARGEIAKPTGSDNSTYWTEDFSRQHFLDMFFNGMPEQGGESFRGVYDEMSSGRFDLEGDVSDWVTVPYHSASYGETESYRDMKRFIEDAAAAWVEAQQTAGKSQDEIKAYLQDFDVWDRYDHDGDGDFEEPDGYIDHFQAIHAGEGEEAGAPTSAIWSHRWAVNYQAPVGPEGAEFGGIEIGDTGLWIRDYTTEPENGGLGVFAHEFAHDLGLPDYYDTAGGENGTGFWTLMSSGSWLSHDKDRAIGTKPNHMGPHEKLFLGWLDHATVEAGESAEVKLGPSFHATKNGPQAVVVNLPDGTHTTDVGPAYSGSGYLYSGRGDDRTATATSPAFTVPEGGQLTAKVDYEIEQDWDYAYAEVSTDGGATFAPVATNLSSDTNPYGSNEGHGITGTTGGEWTDLTADLGAFAGQAVQLRFRMVNDAAVNELGFKVDDVAVGTALTADFEGGDGWTRDGFMLLEGGSYDTQYSHYYIAESRQYGGYDTVLRDGPYNFGWGATAPDRVERFPYQDGLLVWYVNGLYADNNTSAHPGGGMALPVDAHPEALRWSDGSLVRNRVQSFDATFGLDRTDAIALHRQTAAGMTTLELDERPAVPVFDDSDPMRYHDPANPGGSPLVGGTGTTIAVVGGDAERGTMTVEVN